MKKYKAEKVSMLIPSEFTCDVCGSDLLSNFLDTQEALSWSNHCGWGSVFGDGSHITLDICQDCLKAVFGKYIQYEEEE
jgi:hypothetical protein